MGLIEWIAGGVVAALVMIATVVGAWLRGKSRGNQEANERHQREVLERANKHATERQHVEDDIHRSGESAADRLQRDWRRD